MKGYIDSVQIMRSILSILNNLADEISVLGGNVNNTKIKLQRIENYILNQMTSGERDGIFRPL